MADDIKPAVKPDPRDAQIAELKSLLELALADKAAPAVAVNSRLVLAPEHKGTHTYIVGPSKHYRGNRLYEAGERVTVTDERPARDWVLADSVAAAEVAPVKPAGGRASDKIVGS